MEWVVPFMVGVLLVYVPGIIIYALTRPVDRMINQGGE